MMESLWQDLGFGLRGLARRPGFAAVALINLALGIGATSAVLSVVNGVLLSALPYEDPDRLMAVNGVLEKDGERRNTTLSYPDFLDWREGAAHLAELAVYSPAQSFNLTSGGESAHVTGEMTSAGYLELMGQTPFMGRFFTAREDDARSPQEVVVLSHDLWRGRFGSDPDVLGRNLLLNEVSYEVIGVASRGFRGMTDEAELFVPVTLAGKVLDAFYTSNRQFRWLLAVGRLAPGVTIDQARAAMDSSSAALAEQYPRTNQGFSVRLETLSDAWVSDLRQNLFLLLAGAGFVLLIACANLANLLLAQGIARHHEMGLRAALGAGRGRLVRQLLTESVLLTLCGAVLGLLLAQAVTGTLVRASAVDFRSFVDPSVDRLVVGVIVAVAVLCGLAFGLVPALRTSRTRLSETLSQGGLRSAAGGRHVLRSTLIVVQMALALVLFVGAATVIRGFRALQETELGLESDNLLTLRLDLKGESFAGLEPKRVLMERFLEGLRSLPGVAEVALAGPAIPTDPLFGFPLTIEEHRVEPDVPVMLGAHSVSPGYFSTLGIPLLSGRSFTFEDVGSAPRTAVVSEALAKQYWPGESPLDKRLKFGPRQSPGPWFTVVGMVRDARHRGLDEDSGVPDVYFSILQVPPNTVPILNFLVRPKGVPALTLANPVRREIREITPQLAPYDVATLQDRLDRQVAGDRFLVLLMGLFALLALVLASVGIFGVISHTVQQRVREIGIRMALGGQRRDVLRWVVGRGARIALLGVAVGLLLVLAVTRVLTTVFHGVSALDPLTLAATSAVLFLVAVAASWAPALRASRVEPTTTLRAE